jgi:tetratricopeptide (TPR) repeat protein
MIRSLAPMLALALLGAAAAPSPLPTAPATAPPQPPTAQEARAHWPVEGAPDAVQALLDRGVMMLYAFDTGEARVAFGQALVHDPDVALAYWGEAEADTIDINEAQSSAGDQRGADAVAAGRRHLAHASPTERMLIEAIAQRYGRGNKQQRFDRYAEALSSWTQAHRDDPNVLTVAAYARWNASGDLLDAHATPTAKAREILTDLDAALALDPTNLGAHHLRIHLLEETNRAQAAVPDATALASYAYPPGTSHLIHMPGHIWSRVGDYTKLIDDNERAVANDQAWFALGDGPGQQYMRTYHDHDVDFVLYGLSTVGRDDDARSFARHEDGQMQAKLDLRLHDEAAAEREALPGSFSLAIAQARVGNRAAALAARAADKDDPARQDLIDAALALHANDLGARVAAYAKAYAVTKNDQPGDPKDLWATPIGEGYGAALLAAGKPADAETVFATELVRYPNDPHLEWGLAEARRAQGKDDADARAAYRAHWKGTRDLTLADLG